MNGLIRQIAVLSVLWAVCEMLLPDGKQQQMVRMTASLLIMTALLTTAKSWIGQTKPVQSAMTFRIQQTAEDTYRRTALAAAANQLESWCVNMAKRAGYQARAVVWLSMDGGVDHIELSLQTSALAIVTPELLQQMLSQQLGVDANIIQLSMEEE